MIDPPVPNEPIVDKDAARKWVLEVLEPTLLLPLAMVIGREMSKIFGPLAYYENKIFNWRVRDTFCKGGGML